MRIKTGSKVICRLYNQPEKKFYGDFFEGEVKRIFIDDRGEIRYTVLREYGTIDLHRKEIKAILS